MIEKEEICELESALAEDWRLTKNLKENYQNHSEKQIRKKLSELHSNMVIGKNKTVKDLVE